MQEVVPDETGAQLEREDSLAGPANNCFPLKDMYGTEGLEVESPSMAFLVVHVHTYPLAGSPNMEEELVLHMVEHIAVAEQEVVGEVLGIEAGAVAGKDPEEVAGIGLDVVGVEGPVVRRIDQVLVGGLRDSDYLACLHLLDIHLVLLVESAMVVMGIVVVRIQVLDRMEELAIQIQTYVVDLLYDVDHRYRD